MSASVEVRLDTNSVLVAAATIADTDGLALSAVLASLGLDGDDLVHRYRVNRLESPS